MKRDVLVWEEPPPPKHGRKSIWETHLAPLVERPGEWALVRICDTPAQAGGTATHLRTDGKMRLPAGRWEFVARTLADGTGGIYARYLGADTIHLVPPASAPTKTKAGRPQRRSA